MQVCIRGNSVLGYRVWQAFYDAHGLNAHVNDALKCADQVRGVFEPSIWVVFHASPPVLLILVAVHEPFQGCAPIYLVAMRFGRNLANLHVRVNCESRSLLVDLSHLPSTDAVALPVVSGGTIANLELQREFLAGLVTEMQSHQCAPGHRNGLEVRGHPT